jgi:hypothetical protein
MSRRHDDDHDESTDEGQVSEVSGLADAGTPISPGDSVAGQPDSESGSPDEGPTGPDAPTFDERQDRYRRKDEL